MEVVLLVTLMFDDMVTLNVWWMVDGGEESCEVPVCSLPFSGGKINEVTGVSRFSNQIDRTEMCVLILLHP